MVKPPRLVPELKLDYLYDFNLAALKINPATPS